MSFEGIPSGAVQFFINMRFNNNRTYFEENRARYERLVKKPMLSLAGELAPIISALNPQLDTRPGRAVSRIRRDTRFTHDKTPYRDHVWLGYKNLNGPSGGSCGLFFELFPEYYHYGAGYYGYDAATMRKFREKLMDPKKGSVFLHIVQKIESAGFTIAGDKYKRAPQCDVPQKLKRFAQYKSIYAVIKKPLDDAVFSPDLCDILADAYTRLMPFYMFLNE